MNPIIRHSYYQVVRETTQVSPRGRTSPDTQVRRIDKSSRSAFENRARSYSTKENHEDMTNREVMPYKAKSKELYQPLPREVALTPFVPKTTALSIPKEKTVALVAKPTADKPNPAQAEIIKKMMMYNLFQVTEDRHLFNLLSPGLNSINKALMCIEKPEDKEVIDDFLGKYQNKFLELISVLIAGFIVDALLSEESGDSQQIVDDQQGWINQAVQDVTLAIDDFDKMVIQTDKETEQLIEHIQASSLSESEKKRMTRQILTQNDRKAEFLQEHRKILEQYKEFYQNLKAGEVNAFISNKTRDIGTTLLCVVCGFNLPMSVLVSIAINSMSDTSLTKTEAMKKYQTFFEQLEKKDKEIQIPTRQITEGIIDGAMYGLTDKLQGQVDKIHSSVIQKIALKVLEGLISNQIKNKNEPTLSKKELQEWVEVGELKQMKDELSQIHKGTIDHLKGYALVYQSDYNDYLHMKQQELKNLTEKPAGIVASAVDSFFGRLKDLW